MGLERPAALLPAQVVVDLELILLLTGLGFLIVVGLIWVLELRRRMQSGEDDPVPEQSLEHYEALKEQGLLDPQEFERIRVLLEDRAEEPPEPPMPPTAP